MSIKRRWEYHYHKKNVVLPCPPHSLNLEPTNACNLKCAGCSLDVGRKRGMMDLGLFEKLARQAKQIGTEEIRLFLAGEPLLHKQIVEMVSTCTELSLRSIIHTNATNLTPEMSGRLVEAGLSTISLSIDGADKQTYEVARVGADFETTIENSRALLRYIKECGAEKPYVIIQMLRPENEPLEVPDALRELFRGLEVGHYKVLHYHNWRGEAAALRKKSEGTAPVYPCMFLWHELSVGYDGKVMGCCADLNGFLVRGDLTSESILDVWNNAEAQKLRKLHADGRPWDHPLCADCSVPFHKQKVTPLTNLYKERAKAPLRALAVKIGIR